MIQYSMLKSMQNDG